ncbi:hypothetical protein C9374_011154 [Naegleria lovaniensis]|uniref:PH domain-containing protein n=1 Tax=Naegleria lovaniensis TaxID=51637 RepID=A0AA88KCR0_NAELO|nr:uncharacterized protein C9374_011154 [Naegleria lovaniensis]KAG2374075.1 hypothetical protein C9374_011154 [Naegleria lovaniensis]
MFSNTRNRTDSNSSENSNYDPSSPLSASSAGQASLLKQMYSQRDIAFKSGKLVKQGKTVKNWKERYCLLKRDALYYHELTPKGQAGKVKGKISFKEIKGNTSCIHKVTVTVKNKQKQAISIDLPERVYLLYCDSELELNDWYKSIIQVLTMKDENPMTLSTKGVGMGSSTPTTPTNSGGVTQDIFSPKSGTGTPFGSYGSVVSSFGGSSYTGSTPPVGSALSSLKKASPSSSSPLAGVNVDLGDFIRTNSNLSEAFSDDSDSTSSFPRSQNDLLSEFDEWTHHAGTGRNSDADSDNLEGGASGPLLTEDDEYNIAMSAVEIFLKKEEDRTPQEQAYLLALNEYRKKLDEHAKRVNARPDYSLAVGTCIFLIPEKDRSPSEQEYIKDVISAFTDDSKDHDKHRLLPLKIQLDIVKAAKLIKEKPEKDRTEDEKQYLFRVEEIEKQIVKLCMKHGVRVNHSLGTLPTSRLFFHPSFSSAAQKDSSHPMIQHPIHHNAEQQESTHGDVYNTQTEEKLINFQSIEDLEFNKVFSTPNFSI